jgi:hypothetical protein
VVQARLQLSGARARKIKGGIPIHEYDKSDLIVWK